MATLKGKELAFSESKFFHCNPIALRKAKIVCNFGLSECNRVKSCPCREKGDKYLQVSDE